jgi:hypothetical protein
MRYPRSFVGRTISVAVLTFGFCARAENEFRMLDGKQTQARVAGRDITDGPDWSVYLRPDGALIGSQSGKSWTGIWKIRNDKLCMTLPSSPSLRCNEVWMSGSYIRMRENKNQETFDAMVTDHRVGQ